MNKKTVAVQVLSGNPFTFNAFINNFFSNWYDLVDKLYIQIDTTTESYSHFFPEIKKFFYDVCKNDPKIVIKEYPYKLKEFKYNNIQFDNEDSINRLDYHGSILRTFLDDATEDIVLFTHDDCYILDNNFLKEAIDSIANNEKDFAFISCGGVSPSHYVSELYQKHFPDIYKQIYKIESYDKMVGITTCFFMANRLDLINTNCWYDQKTFKKGEISDVFPETVLEEDIFLDVAIYSLYQLFNKKLNRINSLNIEDNIVLFDLFGFDNELEFNKKSAGFKRAGMIHFTSSCLVKNLVYRYLQNNRLVFEPDESSVYGTTAFLERIIFDYLSILNFFDFETYSYLNTFKNIYIKTFENLVSDYNKFIINFEFSDERFKKLNLTNKNTPPYQIDLSKIPYSRINEIIDIHVYTNNPIL